ncbi:MAG: four helix bundle protein [Bdellovibrionales bacterium]|nr:four helix bundle protein [Bdellovibrionales bacterium]
MAVKFYRLVKTLKLKRHLKDQLERAASSVALNLAEGSGRFTRKDQKRFYHIAFASLRECQAVLDLADKTEKEMIELADSLAAHIYCLIKS